MTGWDEGPLDEARIDAAQREWERWRRSVGVAAAGLRTNAEDLRRMAKRVTSPSDEGVLLRMAAMEEALAEQLDGEDWLKSPKAMALMKAQEKVG